MGPLHGVTIVELAGLGALPFATLKLADMGAEVIRVDRIDPGAVPSPHHNEFDRGRRSIAVDLKHPEGVELVLRMTERADALVEAFRPGVAERLGLGPEQAMARNPRLVYGRLTGWGQEGPLAQAAAHSLNYEALTGAVGSIGPVGGPPVPLLQVLGDFAGGGLNLAFGLVCALFEARQSGHGQVIDAAMVDGVASLFTVFYSMNRMGMHTDDLGTNLFDGGAPFYNVYETADGAHITVAPIEPHFYALLLDKLGLAADELGGQWDRDRWPAAKERLAQVFRTRTRAEWCDLLEGTDVCFAPVQRFGEAHDHAHNQARSLFVPSPDGSTQVAPSPRFSRTAAEPGPSPTHAGSDTAAVLQDLGLSPTEADALRTAGVVA